MAAPDLFVMRVYLSIFTSRNTIGPGVIFKLRRCLVVDNRHLSPPLVPYVVVSNQISHEIAHIDSAGHSCIKDCASNRRRVHLVLGNLTVIDQIVWANCSPLDCSIILAYLHTQIIGSPLVV